MTQILVLGGTGKTGRRIVARLRRQGKDVRVGARSHGFDWTDRGTWDTALAGSEAVYLVPFDGEMLTRPFTQRAVELGVERIVLVSGRGVDVPGYGNGNEAVGGVFLDAEAAVRELDIAWTILRPGWFSQNFSEGFFSDWVRAGELRLPAGDGAATFVDAEDIAQVAVATLTQDGHAGQIYELSGPRALTMAEVAAEISAATGRELRYVPVTHEEFVTEQTAQGWPVEDAVGFADLVESIRKGLDTRVSDGVVRVLGREAIDFAEFVKNAEWTAGPPPSRDAKPFH
ncbi:NAD(P)H-binding protein [Amycolatopsis magusensis]|uniref:NAD(P)H-binding protein n=1 Tax=Amycolatopsis magusensis TaxID=882444 RepID=UPI0024A8F95D|nr:NAD(P)H-binding protein [Amycolatopsis magusensis]MDI5979866.1 NAD(P)H-binding protein [Amycolatopsis magusensis]